MTSHSVRSLRAWFSALATVGLAGCVTPGAQRIVGPDGSPMLHVHCGSQQAECFRLAGESCPTGYDYAPIADARDGNFLVRCRAPVAVLQPQHVQPPAPAPAPAITYTPVAAPPPAPPKAPSDWPPGEVGKATEPWSEPAPTASGSAPSNALPPTPRTQLGEVDIGY